MDGCTSTFGGGEEPSLDNLLIIQTVLNHEKRLEGVERMVNQLIKDYSVIEEFFKLIERLSREIESVGPALVDLEAVRRRSRRDRCGL
jgi:hypothetical protein